MRRIFLFLCLFLILCMPVSAIYDNYWDSHYIAPNGMNGVSVAGTPPNGIVYVYADTEEQISDTIGDIKSVTEETLINRAYVYYMKYDGSRIIGLWWSGTYPNSDSDFFGVTRVLYNSVDSVHDRDLAGDPEGNALQAYVQLSTSGWVPIGPIYVLRDGIAPLEANFDYTPSNPTLDDEITFISTSTPVDKIDKYFWSINDASTGYLYAIAANVDNFKFKPENAGNYNVTLTVTNTTTSTTNTISKTITVISGIEVINRVNIKDASTQSLISGAELQIFNHNNNAWINSSYLYTGSTIFPANQTDVVDIYAQAEDFFSAEKLGYIIPKTGGTISLLLSPDGPPSNESLNRIQIIVKEDDSSNPISNVKLTVNQGDNIIVKYTNNDGYAVFELDPEITANILTEKSGYYELSKRLDISSPSSVDELRLIKIVTAPTPTYTMPTPTLPAGQTGGGYNPVTGEYESYYDPETGVYVTPTFASGWENPEFVENICIKTPYPSNWGYMDILQNAIACNGVKGAVNQKLILSLIIITFIALVLSRYAKGIGALAGGIVGSLVCMGMGLLPIWIAILMIVICGIVIAKMIIGGAK